MDALLQRQRAAQAAAPKRRQRGAVIEGTVVKLAPGAPLEVGLLLSEGEPSSPVARLAMAGGLAQLEWSAEVIETQRRIDPLLYPPEAGLQAARGRDFDGLHGFLADSLPDAWGRLLMKRRLEKLGIRPNTLTAVDRLALVGNGGRGALVYRPATTPAEDVGTIDLDALAEQSQLLLLGEDTDLIDTLARLGGASGGARPKVSIGIAADGTLGQNAAADGHDEWIVKFPRHGGSRRYRPRRGSLCPNGTRRGD